MNRRKISSRWMVGATAVLSVLSGCAAQGPATKDELCTDFDAVSNELYRGAERPETCGHPLGLNF